MKILILLFLMHTQWCAGMMDSSYHASNVIYKNWEADSLIHDFILFCIEELNLPTLIHIVIETADIRNPAIDGYLLSPEVFNPTFTHRIIIKENLSNKVKKETVAHELVHLGQVANGSLKILTNQSIIWLGQLFLSPQEVPHNQRPWEKEAINIAIQLLKKYENLKIN